MLPSSRLSSPKWLTQTILPITSQTSSKSICTTFWWKLSTLPFWKSCFTKWTLSSQTNVSKGSLLPASSLLECRVSCTAIRTSSTMSTTVVRRCTVTSVTIPATLKYRETTVTPFWTNVKPTTPSFIAITPRMLPRKTSLFGVSTSLAPIISTKVALRSALPSCSFVGLKTLSKTGTLIS